MVQLKFRTIDEPEVYREIKLCRWINPKGHGINDFVTERYRPQKNKTECSLSVIGKIAKEFLQY